MSAGVNAVPAVSVASVAVAAPASAPVSVAAAAAGGPGAVAAAAAAASAAQGSSCLQHAGNSYQHPAGKNDPFAQENAGKVREIGDAAVWSVSSCKPGFGVDQLRDNCLDTYWQSDGPQPHLVNIQFHRKVTIEDVCIYADYKSDESYTPSRISVRVGTHFNDLQEVEVVDLPEPNGWVRIPLRNTSADEPKPLRAFMVQIAVLSNHQNGRDTHMRQVRIHAPAVSRCKALHVSVPDFKTKDFLRYLHAR